MSIQILYAFLHILFGLGVLRFSREITNDQTIGRLGVWFIVALGIITFGTVIFPQDAKDSRVTLAGQLHKILVFGGSWGSTLALAYGQRFPEYVNGMILRGIFTATRGEIDHFYHGGVRLFFPEVYERFVSGLPDPGRRPIPAYLFSLIESPDPQQRAKYSRLWAAYELKICGLDISDERLEEILAGMDPYVFARLENYYMANGCFLREGQLLDNASKLKHIPIVMVNGRYDVICPPVNAQRLKQRIPHARLVLAESGGHWMGEKPVERELLKAVREFE